MKIRCANIPTQKGLDDDLQSVTRDTVTPSCLTEPILLLILHYNIRLVSQLASAAASFLFDTPLGSLIVSSAVNSCQPGAGRSDIILLLILPKLFAFSYTRPTPSFLAVPHTTNIPRATAAFLSKSAPNSFTMPVKQDHSDDDPSDMVQQSQERIYEVRLIIIHRCSHHSCANLLVLLTKFCGLRIASP